MTTIGPVEYVIIAFPGSRVIGDVAPALAELTEASTVRLLDVIFVEKDRNGDLAMDGFDALDPAVAAFTDLEGALGGVMSDEDVIIASEVLEPGCSGVLIVWEHLWAAKVARAVRRAGGEIVARETIPERVLGPALAGVGSV